MNKPIEIRLSLDISPAVEFFKSRSDLLQACVGRDDVFRFVDESRGNEIVVAVYPAEGLGK